MFDYNLTFLFRRPLPSFKFMLAVKQLQEQNNSGKTKNRGRK